MSYTGLAISGVALGVFIIGAGIFMTSFLYSIRQPVNHINRDARTTPIEILPTYGNESVELQAMGNMEREDTEPIAYADLPPAYSPPEYPSVPEQAHVNSL